MSWVKVGVSVHTMLIKLITTRNVVVFISILKFLNQGRWQLCRTGSDLFVKICFPEQKDCYHSDKVEIGKGNRLDQFEVSHNYICVSVITLTARRADRSSTL